LTADTIRKLLAELPVRVVKKIQKLSKETGASVETIVEHGVDLYEKRANTKLTRGNDRLAELMRDPKNRALFQEFTAAMGQRSSATANLTIEQKTARSSAGGAARADKLTQERRTEIAKAASQAAKKKREEKRKLAEPGGSKASPVV
jgi:hypothetical protein